MTITNLTRAISIKPPKANQPILLRLDLLILDLCAQLPSSQLLLPLIVSFNLYAPLLWHPLSLPISHPLEHQHQVVQGRAKSFLLFSFVVTILRMR